MVDAEFITDFTRRWLAAWNSHEPAEMLELCTDDVRWHDPVLPETVTGPEAVEEFLRNTWTCFPDLLFESVGPPFIDVAGRKGAQPWRATGTMLGPALPTGFAPTGRPIVGWGIDLYEEFRDGLLARYRTVYDLADWLRQMGLGPARGSRAERTMALVQRTAMRLRPRPRPG